MPHTPFQFPCVTQQELRRFCPSKQHGKLWKNELAFRDDCIDVIERTCAALDISACSTQERAVILMHRYFSTTSSAKCTGLAKWVHTVACLYIVLKADSVYHRLDSIVHSAIVELRKMQQRQMEPEYFNADGTPGNANYLAKLAELVVQAEMDVLLSVNFAIDIRVPTGMLGHYMKKLNLTEEAEMQHPEVAAKINAVRREAVQITHACCGKGTAVVLLHPPEHLAMAALYTACKANNLQWYLGPPEADRQEQEAVALMQGHLRVREELKGEGKIRVPDLPLARLKAIAADLPAVAGMGSALKVEPQDNDGHGCFRSRGGRWLGKRASRPALVKYEGGIRLSSNATDSSNGEAATGLPRLCDPSPSPDSANGPSSAAQHQQPGGSGSGGSSRSQQQQARHVSFGALPPSVALLQAQFRQQRAQEEKYRRERSPEPCASLDSDLQDLQEPLLGSGPAGQEAREQQRQALCGQLKRSRDESVGLAAGSDEEDSAMSRPALKEQGVEADSAGSSKRARVAVAGSSA